MFFRIVLPDYIIVKIRNNLFWLGYVSEIKIKFFSIRSSFFTGNFTKIFFCYIIRLVNAVSHIAPF